MKRWKVTRSIAQVFRQELRTAQRIHVAMPGRSSVRTKLVKADMSAPVNVIGSSKALTKMGEKHDEMRWGIVGTRNYGDQEHQLAIQP